MSDLKRALEGASDRFDLEPGAIDRFFRRRERQERRRRIAAITLVMVLAGAGILVARAIIGADTGRIPASELPGFPEGSFEHVATVEEAVADGFTEQEARQAFGPDGELPMTFVFDTGGYQHITIDDDGVSEVGDSGTYTAQDGKVTMVSASVGCPGCVETYRWTFDGETLALELLSSSAGEADFQDVRLHTAYRFQKVS